MLEFKTGNVPAFADTRAQFSCVRSVLTEFLYIREIRCTFSSFSVSCFLTNGQRCEVTNAVKINIESSLLSWDHEFKILRGCPYPPILGLDFHNRTKMLVHVDARKFAFGFARIIVIHFPSIEWTPAVKIFSKLARGSFGDCDVLRSLFSRYRSRPFGCQVSGAIFINFADDPFRKRVVRSWPRSFTTVSVCSAQNENIQLNGRRYVDKGPR
jgi:hypothetical protein